jgi:predicted RNA-binding Zn-ribbon protein involved in translation (DUF1610 family)
MISEISSLISSAKAAYDIAKGISSLKAGVERNQSISNLISIILSVQSDALSMQSKYQDLLQEKDNLAKKLMEFEKWTEIEKQYELKEMASGVFLYVYKQPDNSKEPVHWLCPNCWQDKIKSIIQCMTPTYSSRARMYSCPKCKNVLKDF